MELRIGIDPGIYGAISAWDKENRMVLDVCDMPHGPKLSGRGNRILAPLVFEIMTNIAYGGWDILWPPVVILENNSSRPANGASAARTAGIAHGIIEGVCAAMKLPIELSSPAAWQRKAGLWGKPKEATYGLCLSEQPETAFWLQDCTKKQREGRADAIMIAKYGRKSD